MTAHPHQMRRKIVFIHPRFQGGAVLAFVAIVIVGWALFTWVVCRDVRQALLNASLAGHYKFRSAYDIVGESVVRHLAGLFAGVLLAGIALFFLLIRRIGIATERIAAVFRTSGEGDLSTPADVPGPGEFAAFGKEVDLARSRTLDAIERIRAEVGLLRKESLPEDEFLKRWEGLKEKIGRFAP